MSRRKHAIEAYFQSGAKLHRAGRLAEAEQTYLQVLAAAPTHADSRHLLGVIALQSGQPAIAIGYIDSAIALKPSAALYHVNRANALLALGQTEAAIVACRRALQLKRDCAEACQTLGHALSDAGAPHEAIATYRDALRHNANLPDLHNDLGLALRQANLLEEAADTLRQAVGRAPRDVQVRSNLAGVLKELARLPESEASYREALNQAPTDALLHFNLALLLLLDGRFAEGWSEYEWRFKARAAQLAFCAEPRWSGEPLAGRSLLIRSEQGFGDMLQFCRFVPPLASTGAGRLILEVHPRMQRLLACLPGGITIVAQGGELPAFDLHCPLLSLPGLVGTPALTVPYLTTEADRVVQWRNRLGPQGFKVGIAWQGNPTSQAEQGRSIPLDRFLPLSRMAGVRLISLQKHHGLDQLADVPDLQIETLGDAFDAGPDAFVDTAAVMQSLDLIVTSDTSVAHLAGALGRPVWLALQHVPDWRWMMERSDSPWYPSMRLFRQATRGDWEGVFARIAQSLAALAAA